jgi:hypothetical protein
MFRYILEGSGDADAACNGQLNETELKVSTDASYKQRLEVLEQQEELIEDEAEQEQVNTASVVVCHLDRSLTVWKPFAERGGSAQGEEGIRGGD